MACDRRSFLAGLGGALLLGPSRLLAGRDDQRLLSCRSDHAGRHHVTLFDSAGRRLLDVPLPGRGHGIALSHDRRTAVVFARRPGDFLVVLDLAARRERLRLQSPPDRHFYGHGVFSRDDTLLYATENAFDEDGEGRIGVYAANDGFRRVGEFASHGIGPHQLCLAPDGQTLLVANGGIRTHPDMPRAKLNLADMQASLAYVDRSDGRLHQHVDAPLPWQRLSIRHIDVNRDGLVAIAMQYEGPRGDRPPLLGLHRRGSDPMWLQAPADVQKRMRNYCGSVAFTPDGSGFAVSSPRGGLITHWTSAGDYLDNFAQADVCGIAGGPDGLWFSDGDGGLRTRNDDTYTHFGDTRWDNHLTAV